MAAIVSGLDTAAAKVVDSSGNEVVQFAGVSSAVNEVMITNAATGNPVLIAATGGDTNIDLNLVPKGTGTVQVNGEGIVVIDGDGFLPDTVLGGLADVWRIGPASRRASLTTSSMTPGQSYTFNFPDKAGMFAVTSDLTAVTTNTSSSLANGAGITVDHTDHPDPNYIRRVSAHSEVTTGGAVLLLNGNGTDGSTTFTDSSSAARTVTANGNVQIDTAQKKYGTGSILFDGTGDYLSFTGTISDFAFGTGDYTVEFWLRLNTVSGSQTLIDFRAGGGSTLAPMLFMSGATVQLYLNSGFQITSSSLSTGTWYHVALCRSGSSTRLFINDVQSGSTYTNSSSLVCGTNGPWIGFDGGTYSLNGWLDDIRFTRGALYTGTSNPPAAELGVGGDTYKSPIDCPAAAGLTVRYDDGAGADPTTKTTFTNNTGATLTNVVAKVETFTVAP